MNKNKRRASIDVRLARHLAEIKFPISALFLRKIKETSPKCQYPVKCLAICQEFPSNYCWNLPWGEKFHSHVKFSHFSSENATFEQELLIACGYGLGLRGS